MPVYYDNKAIIPAPFCVIQKNYQTSDDGAIIGSVFNIRVTGTLVAYKGSPNSSKVFWTISGYPPDEVLAGDAHFPAILRKQEAIKELFANEGRTFQIQPYNGAPPVTCNPRIKGITFQEGNWFDLCKYEIDLEADVIYISGDAVDEDSGSDVTTYKVQKANEDWSLEPADDSFLTYRLTHRLSATGKRFYNSSGTLTQEAWLNAKDFVTNKLVLGLDSAKITASLVNLNPNASYSAYNYARSETISERTGSYAMSETWLLYAPATSFAAVDTFSVVTRIGQDGKVECSIDGTLTGLQVSNNTTQAVTSTKYTNAAGRFAEIEPSLFTRAQTYAGVTLNSVTLTKNVTRNVQTGIITYSYTYDNRPTTIVPGAISESIQITFNNPTDVFAKINVLARSLGPILQNILTISETVKTVAMEAQMPADTVSFSSTEPNVDSYIASITPISGSSTVFVSRNEKSFNSRTGRWSKNVSWTYTA